jgi:hypothetical protein
MLFRAELHAILKTILTQLTSRSNPHTKRTRASDDLAFTKNFYSNQYGLTEADARDVYYSGYAAKYKTKWLQDKMMKDYNGYQTGISYFKDARTGKPVVSSIWKSENKTS